MTLCDTNILIEVYRNNSKVITELEKIGQENVVISYVTACELIFGARNKKELTTIVSDLTKITLLPMSADVSQNAFYLMTQFSLSHHLSLPDALIAATALDFNIPIYTHNLKDFKYIPGIRFH